MPASVRRSNANRTSCSFFGDRQQTGDCVYLAVWGIVTMTVHFQPSYPTTQVREITPAALVYQRQSSVYTRVSKRLLDLVMIALLALPALIIMAIVLPLIALDGHSPIYRQDRVGRSGRIFKLWKLRSMIPDADQKLAAFLAQDPAAQSEWDRHQKLIDDPRITRIGRFIRKTSIDELPQLLNVLTGDMSLVGPRPMMTDQQDIYPGAAYYDMRPGITGAWQVSERHETSFAERALFDTRYYNQISLGTDLGIIARTFGVVLKAAGA